MRGRVHCQSIVVDTRARVRRRTRQTPPVGISGSSDTSTASHQRIATNLRRDRLPVTSRDVLGNSVTVAKSTHGRRHLDATGMGRRSESELPSDPTGSLAHWRGPNRSICRAARSDGHSGCGRTGFRMSASPHAVVPWSTAARRVHDLRNPGRPHRRSTFVPGCSLRMGTSSRRPPCRSSSTRRRACSPGVDARHGIQHRTDDGNAQQLSVQLSVEWRHESKPARPSSCNAEHQASPRKRTRRADSSSGRTSPSSRRTGRS